MEREPQRHAFLITAHSKKAQLMNLLSLLDGPLHDIFIHIDQKAQGFSEQELRDAVSIHGFNPVRSPCPLDGHTVRQTVKELIAALGKDNPLLYDHLAAGMRQSALGELWPASKTRDEMKETYFNYMYGQPKKA